MQLGCLTMPIMPRGRDWRKSLREDQAAFMLADDLGFAEGYFGTHAVELPQNDTSCLLFIASLAAKVRHMRLGAITANRPHEQPADAAAQVALLDRLLGGRLNLCISSGGPMADGGLPDIPRPGGTSRERSGGPANLRTRRADPFAAGPGSAGPTVRRRQPPVLVTAVDPYCKVVTAAAARGWDPISTHFVMPRWVATHRDSYLRGCVQGGRPGDPASWRVARSIFVADDLNTARDYARGPRSPYVHYYRQLLARHARSGRVGLFKEDPCLPDKAVTLDAVLDRLVIWGTPEKVADEIEALRETVGPFGTLLYAGHDWADADLARRSMVLLAERVRPRIAHLAQAAE